MSDEGLNIRAAAAPPWSAGIDLLVMQRRDGKEFVGVQLAMAERDPQQAHVTPTISIGADVARQLMDDLWAAGVRPSADVARDRTIEGMEKHLEDLRTIAIRSGGG